MILCILACAFFLNITKDGQAKTGGYNGYILKEYNGKIAVFSGDNSTPVEVFDVEYSSLPYADRQELSAGIKADNLKKIYQIAEDFDG